MKIAIDCRYLGKSGIGRVTEGILDSLDLTANEYWLIGRPAALNKYEGAHIVEDDSDPYSVKGLLSFPKQLNELCDAVLIPNFLIPFGIRLPVYAVMHDLAFLDVKETTKGALDRLIKRTLLKRCMKRAKEISCVSAFTKQRCEHYYGKLAAKCFVNYNGLSESVIAYARTHAPAGKADEIVFVGNVKPHKGLKTLLAAFSRLEGETKLKIIGEKEHFLTGLDLDESAYRNVEFTGRLTDGELLPAIARAKYLVLPSVYEGFGLPPLEAMRCGCPVIVSNNSSLPEVVGDTGIMIDYDSVEQHVQAYESYYYNPALRERNARKGLERTRQFSWDSCVETIVGSMLELERRKRQEPLVTVVTVTYNLLKSGRKNLIRQCIESVHSQTYPNIEHIIIDGASTDGTRELLEDYARKGWVTLYSEPDKGIYDAMNKGIAKANGLYVNFLNSDDYFHDEQGIAVSVEQLMKCNADYSFADTRMTQGKGKYSSWKGDISKLLIGVHYCHQTMLVKTEALRLMGGFDLSYPVSADSDMMIRLYALGYRHTYVPYCFLTYQKGGFSGEHKAQSRIDHATAFFRHIGSRVGLTLSDCFLLWQQRLFEELPFDKRLRLIAKVPAEFGAEDLMRQIIANPHREEYMIPKQQLQFYLFGFIPLLSRKYRRNKTYYRLFNVLRIMKKVEYNNKRKYYLFGFLPVWKVKALK